MTVDLSAAITVIITAYLLGSIPFGLVLSKGFMATDPRKIGSGNIGATNARRVGGWPLAISVLILDMAKGAIPVGIGLILFGKDGNVAQAVVFLSALAAFLGHLYPVYLGFKSGGKGVATAGGCFLALSPGALAAALGMFLAATVLSRRVSAGSLAAAAALPVAVFFVEKSAALALGTLVFTIFIILRHRENIIRLANRSEPPIY